MSIQYTGDTEERVYSADLNSISYGNENAVLSGCATTESSPAAMTVEVASGSIFFGNDQVDVTADTPVITANTSAYTRIDLVLVDNTGTITVTAGTPSALPRTPDFDPDSYIVLSRIEVSSGASSILTTNIKDLRTLNVGGGSSGGGTSSIGRYTEDFTSQTALVVTHNLGDENPIVQVYDDSSPPEQLEPQDIIITDLNTVTINFTTSTSGFVTILGGVGFGNSKYTEPYTSSTTWNVAHNLGSQYVQVQCYDTSSPPALIEPQDIELTDEDNLVVTWGVATAGQVIVTGGASNIEVLSLNITDTQTAASVTIDANDSFVVLSGASNSVTATLPTAVGRTGKIYYVKAIDLTNTVKVDGNGAETIDGSADYTFLTANDTIGFISNGTNWYIF